MRGGSQSGNLDARELIQLGLADIICADYHVPSLLPSAFRLVDEGLMDLPAAVRMLTLSAARAVGLSDRGAIRAGLLADLLLVQMSQAGGATGRARVPSRTAGLSFVQSSRTPALTAN